jgi:hypothetical protein
MTFNNIFENQEFNTKLNSLKIKISNFLNDGNIDLGDLNIDSLIQWHDTPNHVRRIYPHENCPTEVRNTIIKFIKEEFPG